MMIFKQLSTYFKFLWILAVLVRSADCGNIQSCLYADDAQDIDHEAGTDPTSSAVICLPQPARRILKKFKRRLITAEVKLLRSRQLQTVYYLPSRLQSLQTATFTSGSLSVLDNDHLDFRFKFLEQLHPVQNLNSNIDQLYPMDDTGWPSAVPDGTVIWKAQDMKHFDRPKFVSVKFRQQCIKEVSSVENMTHQISLRLFPEAARHNVVLPSSQQMSTYHYLNGTAVDVFLYPYYETNWQTSIDYMSKYALPISLPCLQKFTVDMLQALRYLRANSVIHLDLRPRTISFTNIISQKVSYLGSFESAIDPTTVREPHFTGHYAYSSPEYMFKWMRLGQVSFKADMWSLGATLYHIVTAKPLIDIHAKQYRFENTDEMNALVQLMQRVPKHQFGRLSRGYLVWIARRLPRRNAWRAYMDDLLRVQNSYRRQEERFDELIDFISKCLIWDPEQRMDLSEALEHSFVTRMHRN